MLRLAASLDVSNTFRHIFPEKREYSFVSNLGRPCRLDRVYVSNSLLNSVVNVDHPPNANSDHTFLQVDLDLQPIARGKNSWNLPSTLLEDTVYLDKVRNFWIGWKNRKHFYNSIFEWWDEGKTRIKSLSISYAHKTSKASRKHETSLDKRLRNAIAGGKSGLIRHFSAKFAKLGRRELILTSPTVITDGKKRGEKAPPSS